MPSETRLIIGCGYLGRHVARDWLAAGHRVVALTRSSQHAAELAALGCIPCIGDVTQPDTLRFPADVSLALCALGYDARGQASRQAVQLDGLRHVLDALPSDVRRVILISSTGVYGQTDGSDVDEETPAVPLTESGRACLAGEQLLAAHRLGARRVVLRLAGIYGPGRLPRRDALLAGQPLAADPCSLLNLIHVADASAAVSAAAEHPAPSPLYLVSDGQRLARGDYYATLAAAIGAPPPGFSPDDVSAATRGSGHKHIVNARALAELRLGLRYPTFHAGLAACLADACGND